MHGSPRRCAPRDDKRMLAPRDDKRMLAPRDDKRMLAPRDDERMLAFGDGGGCTAPDDDALFVTASAAWQSMHGSPRRNEQGKANIAVAKGHTTPCFHFHFQLRSTT
jgi:hypothetical protein